MLAAIIYMNQVMRTSWWLAVALVAANTLRAEGYRTTLGTAPDNFPVIVVSGTPYEMGLALGTLAASPGVSISSMMG